MKARVSSWSTSVAGAFKSLTTSAPASTVQTMTVNGTAYAGVDLGGALGFADGTAGNTFDGIDAQKREGSNRKRAGGKATKKSSKFRNPFSRAPKGKAK